MNLIFLLISVVLFLSVNFNVSNAIDPPIGELNALQHLISKFNLTYLPNSSFCKSFTCNETTGSLIMSLTGNSEEYTPIGAVLVLSDILPFSNLINLDLKNFNTSYEFFYYKFEPIKNLFHTNFRGINEINQTLPAYDGLYLDCDSFNNKTFKMSYIHPNTKYFSFQNSFLNLINDFPPTNKLYSLLLSINNLPDISNYNMYTISLNIGANFNVSSFVENYKTIKAISRIITMIPPTLDIYFPIETLADQYVTSSLASYIMTFGLKFNGPVDNKPLNISNNKIGYLSFINPGSSFYVQVNSQFQFPLILGYGCKITLENAKISQTIPLSQFGSPFMVIINNSSISGNLDLYQPSDSSYPSKTYVFKDNSITGTIDQSWCRALLVVRNNKMTGPIPSCFSCYYKYPILDSSIGTFTTLYGAFEGNNFTNLDLNLPCTTFKPQIERYSDITLLIYGDDIGFYGDLYRINGTINGIKYQTIEYGKKYLFFIDSRLSFTGVNYLAFNFKFPFDKDYYFPLIQRSPIVNYVFYSNEILQVNGSFFASYLGHSEQTITISNYTFQLSDSIDFFSIQATPSTPISISTTTKYQLLTLITNSKIKRVYIDLLSINNNICPNDCTDDDHGICNLYTGGCVCFSDFIGDDCSHPNFFITSVQPSTTNGGEAVFFGSFSQTTTFENTSLTIGALDCPITFNSLDTIKCNAPPGNGIKTVMLKQNNKEFTGVGIYKYIDISIPCPNKCSNNGLCNSTTGICKCNNGYTLFDCSALINTDNGNNPGGGTNTTIDPGTGSTNITSSQTHFQIYLKSLIEVDINNNQIKSYSLLKNWIFNKTENEIEPNKYILKQQLINNNSTNSNGCMVTSTIEEIKDKNGKEFTFAGTSFIVSSGSIKFTISISNYTYQNNLNTLKLELISSVDKIDTIDNCNSKDTEIDTSNVNDISTFNYIKISKNNKIFSGRFINKVMSDGRSTFFTTTTRNDSNSIIVTLNLPHCINECLIDPDFSVLVSNDFKSECDDDSSRKWFLPVVVVVPVVGVAFIIIILFIIYKKSLTFKIMIHATKLKKLNNK
ncbi:hypothetical protein ACTFIU_003610 [Dictyostelium citrinum]